MGPFGRNAQQDQSKSDIPPELRAYYDSQSAKGAPARRSLVLLLPLVVLIFAVAAVGTSIWFHARNTSSTVPGHATVQPANKASSTQKNSTTSKSSSPSPPIAQNPPTNPNTPSAPSSLQSRSSTQTTTQPSSTSIPNTGPGATSLVLALGAGFVATFLSYARQIRVGRK